MKYIDNRINANIVKLEDENNNYMSEDVEGALEEIDSKIKSIEANGYDDTQIKQDINNIKNEIGSTALNTDAINIKDAINKVNTRINTVEANAYDDTQIRQNINNIKTELGTEELTTTDQTIKGAVNEIDSQIKDIVYLIDNPNFELIGDMEYKLKNNITLETTLNIPDNVKIKGFGKTITSNFDGIVLNAKGKNITIDGLKIDCNNHACTGILINSNSEKINIINNEVYNSYGGTTHPVYGIFISAIGCSDINVENNFVHDIISNDNGQIGHRDGGWAKGILVDLYDVIDERPNNDSVISTNITINNNSIVNIQDFSDADGIYIEGYKCSKNSYVQITNNYLKNCGKRFIKVLNSGATFIKGNYGIHEDSLQMHSFMSLYSGNVYIKDNIMKVLDTAGVRYGIEIGYQSKYEDVYVNDILIEDNKFNIGTLVNYGNVIARPDYDGKLNNVRIRNNILEGGCESIKFQNGAEIKNIEIIDNVLKSNISNRSAILIADVSVDKISIDRNKLEEDSYSNAIVINNAKQGQHIIRNNMIGKCLYSCIKNINSTLCIIENNILNTTTIGYSLENTLNSKTNNNFDIRLNTNIEQ